MRIYLLPIKWWYLIQYLFFFNQSSVYRFIYTFPWHDHWRIMSSNSSILTSNWMTLRLSTSKYHLWYQKFDKSYDRCNKNPFKQLTLIKTCSLWNIFIMSLPPRYAIAKKGQVDKYSKIFGLFGNLAIRVCQGPSTCTRTFKHGDPGYEVGSASAVNSILSIAGSSELNMPYTTMVLHYM